MKHRAAERATRRAANTAAEDKRIADIVDAEKARQKAAYEERYKKGWNFDFRWIGKRWRYVGYNIGPFGRPGKTGTMFQKMPDGSWELWLRGLAPRPRIIDGEDRTPPPNFTSLIINGVEFTGLKPMGDDKLTMHVAVTQEAVDAVLEGNLTIEASTPTK